MPAQFTPATRSKSPAAGLGAVDEELVGGPEDLLVATVAAIGENATGKLLTVRRAIPRGLVLEAERPGRGTREADGAAEPPGFGCGGHRRYRPSSSISGSCPSQRSSCSRPTRIVFCSVSSVSQGSEGCPSGGLRNPCVSEDFLFVEENRRRGKYFSGSLKNRCEASVDLLHPRCEAPRMSPSLPGRTARPGSKKGTSGREARGFPRTAPPEGPRDPRADRETQDPRLCRILVPRF
jgi:hypothetical protein